MFGGKGEVERWRRIGVMRRCGDVIRFEKVNSLAADISLEYVGWRVDRSLRKSGVLSDDEMAATRNKTTTIPRRICQSLRSFHSTHFKSLPIFDNHTPAQAFLLVTLHTSLLHLSFGS